MNCELTCARLCVWSKKKTVYAEENTEININTLDFIAKVHLSNNDDDTYLYACECCEYGPMQIN